jgi:hypothetical protein
MDTLETLARDAARIGIDADTALGLLESSGYPLTYGNRVKFRMIHARITDEGK